MGDEITMRLQKGGTEGDRETEGGFEEERQRTLGVCVSAAKQTRDSIFFLLLFSGKQTAGDKLGA